jgi:hypothetical protein
MHNIIDIVFALHGEAVIVALAGTDKVGNVSSQGRGCVRVHQVYAAVRVQTCVRVRLRSHLGK